jgi:hypothetical protein
MKEIKLPRAIVISAFNGPTESITPELADQIMRPVEKNKLCILDVAFDIERKLDRIITYHFFQDKDENKIKSQEFQSLILKSDWCTYGSKRKLIIQIVHDLELLKGKEKDEYSQLLRKTMSYRNAFAHGEIAIDGRDVQLSYFEGEPKAKILTDEYLAEIETNLLKCWDTTFNIGKTSGAMKVHGAKE